MSETTKLEVKSCERPTIMDGKVVTYATEFIDQNGAFGPYRVAVGAFEVSASRNCVLVQRARITKKEDLEALKEALDKAFENYDTYLRYR